MPKRALCGLVAGVAMILTMAGCNSGSRPSSVGGGVRVGVFDSRAVAIAWCGSEAFSRQLGEKRARVEKAMADAKAKGDGERVKALEAEMWGLQETLHKQGFSTWPVHDILAHIQDDIARIAAEAKVDAIVSKWDLAYGDADAGFVDVTHEIVEVFKPSAKTRKSVEQILEKDPVPLAQLKGHGKY